MATMTETVAQPPETYKLELATGYGPVYRDVLRTPSRNCDASEVPTIDLSGVNGDEQQRQALAKVIREAATNTGFFYMKNHGIPKEKIDAAYKQARTFFSQPKEKKALVAQSKSKFYNGWSQRGHISPTESQDLKEGFSFRYDPKYDPQTKDLSATPEDVKKWLRCEDFMWEGTSHLPGFKDDLIAYWQSCLTLARNLIKIFALALDVPENYFDDVVTYPGR
jgi:isopenicillin N synthase-like dioxygenase